MTTTPSRFKDFGSPAALNENSEPVVFQLYGQTFKCVPEVQGKAILDLVAGSSSEDTAKSSTVILNFFNQVLTAESLPAFNTLLESADKIVSIELLGEISAWLIEEYTNRPNQQPEA